MIPGDRLEQEEAEAPGNAEPAGARDGPEDDGPFGAPGICRGLVNRGLMRSELDVGAACGRVGGSPLRGRLRCGRDPLRRCQAPV